MQSIHKAVRMAVLACLIAWMAIPSIANTWRGTAPFCEGHCQGNEEQIGVSDSGDGGYCVTGHKALCRNASALCAAKETKASCYGVVMVCENGFHESLNQNWHACNSYACGVCAGISISSTRPQSTTGGGGYQADICKQGYVWREAAKGDHVCVTPAVRTQAAQDNAAAAGRRVPNGAYGPDTCKPGFVWREAFAGDHACVVPAVRSAAADDNRQGAGRRAAQAVRVVVDTCKQGYVWREAIRNDHVCVTPATRTQAAQDNAAAASRRANGGASGPDTCRPGFVWREVVPSDHVCVSPAVRAAAAQDAAMAAQRLAR
ncbi:hypothetical protein [Ramlibacter sp.]|uniref:hypothetical protein n=1 Tax=Ramlibacter sp. TaxID=1917967 RepID=UPI001809609F|nr:hypothetical protein [Ramlibacter sp.]MBA2675202.1 hypothetical protein [Ramlibacter sp.]